MHSLSPLELQTSAARAARKLRRRTLLAVASSFALHAVAGISLLPAVHSHAPATFIELVSGSGLQKIRRSMKPLLSNDEPHPNPPRARTHSMTGIATKSASAATSALASPSAPATAAELERVRIDGDLFDAPPGAVSGVRLDPRSRYLARVLQQLQRTKFYPAAAKRRGEQGVVEVAFRLAKSGAIEEIELEVPSSWPRLNEAAVEAVRQFGRLDPIPDDVSAHDLVLIVPYRYQLR
jgi:protein TonB